MWNAGHFQPVCDVIQEKESMHFNETCVILVIRGFAFSILCTFPSVWKGYTEYSSNHSVRLSCLFKKEYMVNYSLPTLCQFREKKNGIISNNLCILYQSLYILNIHWAGTILKPLRCEWITAVILWWCNVLTGNLRYYFVTADRVHLPHANTTAWRCDPAKPQRPFSKGSRNTTNSPRLQTLPQTPQIQIQLSFLPLSRYQAPQ